MANDPNILNATIPVPQLPLVDPRTGIISPQWMFYFISLDARTGGGGGGGGGSDGQLALILAQTLAGQSIFEGVGQEAPAQVGISIDTMFDDGPRIPVDPLLSYLIADPS